MGQRRVAGMGMHVGAEACRWLGNMTCCSFEDDTYQKLRCWGRRHRYIACHVQRVYCNSEILLLFSLRYEETMPGSAGSLV